MKYSGKKWEVKFYTMSIYEIDKYENSVDLTTYGVFIDDRKRPVFLTNDHREVRKVCYYKDIQKLGKVIKVKKIQFLNQPRNYIHVWKKEKIFPLIDVKDQRIETILEFNSKHFTQSD